MVSCCGIRSDPTESLHSDVVPAAPLTPAQLSDLTLMRELLPRPSHHTQPEWDDILLLEAPSVLGLASRAADVLDTESVSDAELQDSERSSPSDCLVAGGSQELVPSPADTCTSMPYSPTDSEAPAEYCINVETPLPYRPSLADTMHPAEVRSLDILASGCASGAAVTSLLNLLPHTGRPIQAMSGHVHLHPPRSFSTGAYARGPNTGLMRGMHDYPFTSLLLARIVRSCAPEHCFSSVTLLRNLFSNMHRDSFNSRWSPNILVPLSHFEQGGLWVEDPSGELALEQGGPVGRVLPIVRPYTILWPQLRHATLPWQGDRLLLVGYHIGFASRLSPRDRHHLDTLGFCLEGRR